MSGKVKQGDLVIVSGISEVESRACIVIRGPYPAVFTYSQPNAKYSEEKFAVDIMCDGKIYTKVKVEFLFRIVSEQ